VNDRARIPFALVGVLLLASSATLAPALQSSPTLGPPDVDVAMDRLTAQARGAIEEGVEGGARRAAREPVVDPANTTFGRVLSDDRTFRDALKIRIYATVRDHLSSIGTARRGLDLNASLPPTPTPAALQRAIDRVSLARAGPNGTAVRASVGQVTLTARRDGQVVARKRIDPSVVVPVPVLPVHERVRTFEERLDGGPLEPGLGRRLTAATYALTWARGYAQYRGLPIQNVVANRHLSLLANAGVLRTQQRVFGRSDPAGRRVHALTTLKTAVVEVLGARAPNTLATLRRVRRAIRIGQASLGPVLNHTAGGGSPPDPASATTVGINATADRAFYDLLGSFNESIDETFTADVRLRAVVEARYGGPPDWPAPPSDDCRRLASTREESVDVVGVRGEVEPTPSDWHLLEASPRRVDVTRTKRRTWRCGGRTVSERETSTEFVNVVLRLEGSHRNGPAPPAPIEVVHEPAGPFGGPNLADVRESARAKLVAGEEDLDALARAAARGRDVERTGQVQGEWPGPLSEWIYTNVATLRETVRDVTVTTTRGDVATFQASPAAKLLEKLRNRSTRLVGVPARYENVAHRALIGLRYRYVQLVLERMRDRAHRRNVSRRAFGSELRDRENVSLETVQRTYQRRNDFAAVPAADVVMRVHAAPAYLTTENTTHDAVPALDPGESLHPMVVRNLNLFTLPYGEFADAVGKLVFGPNHVRLRTGAQILRNARRLARHNASVSRSPEVARLRAETAEALDVVEEYYGLAMDHSGVGAPAGWSDVFDRVVTEYDTVSSRAFAVSDGSIVPRLVEAAADRWPDRLDGPVWRDRVGVTSRVVLDLVLETDPSGPTQPGADEAMGPVRESVETAIGRKLGDALTNASMAALRNYTTRSWSRLPSGLPVAPIPGLWHATVNAWRAQVRGEYARFAVTVPRGTPGNPGASLAYIRDGATVAVDVDEDGQPERLGNASRVSFRTGTWVGIAVPPYSPGVGDVDGTRNETSAGWPWPSDPPGK